MDIVPGVVPPELLLDEPPELLLELLEVPPPLLELLLLLLCPPLLLLELLLLLLLLCPPLLLLLELLLVWPPLLELLLEVVPPLDELLEELLEVPPPELPLPPEELLPTPAPVLVAELVPLPAPLQAAKALSIAIQAPRNKVSLMPIDSCFIAFRHGCRLSYSVMAAIRMGNLYLKRDYWWVLDKGERGRLNCVLRLTLRFRSITLMQRDFDMISAYYRPTARDVPWLRLSLDMKLMIPWFRP
jgi:hypothetical protein